MSNRRESTKFGVGEIMHMYVNTVYNINIRVQSLILNDTAHDLAVCSTTFCTHCLHWIVCLLEKLVVTDTC